MNFAVAALDTDDVDDDRPVDVIRVGVSAQQHIDAYLEYRAYVLFQLIEFTLFFGSDLHVCSSRIVGNADGGKLLSEAEFAAFKARAIEARKNRIYVCWRNINSDIDCKNIGPESKCFCTHRYREHATDNWESKNVHCRAKGCKVFFYSCHF
jgi:hypothetical protein